MDRSDAQCCVFAARAAYFFADLVLDRKARVKACDGIETGGVCDFAPVTLRDGILRGEFFPAPPERPLPVHQPSVKNHHESRGASLRPSCRNSVSTCSTRKAPEPSKGEGFGVCPRRPRMDFICLYGPKITVFVPCASGNREKVQAR